MLPVIAAEPDIRLIIVFDKSDVICGQAIRFVTTVGRFFLIGYFIGNDDHLRGRRRCVHRLNRARTLNPGALQFLHDYCVCSAGLSSASSKSATGRLIHMVASILSRLSRTVSELCLELMIPLPRGLRVILCSHVSQQTIICLATAFQRFEYLVSCLTVHRNPSLRFV